MPAPGPASPAASLPIVFEAADASALTPPLALSAARALGRGLWAVISVAPAVAAGVLPLMAFAVGAWPALAVAVGLLAATTGLALLLGRLEAWVSQRPAPHSVPEAEDDPAASIDPGATSSQDAAASAPTPINVNDVSYEHVVLRQRFVTQAMMPGAAHVRARPAPIVSPQWSLVAGGIPDGMGYNWIVNRGDGRAGDTAVLTLIDQIAIVSLSRQQLHTSHPRLGPGELFYGPMVGGYVGSAMLLAEVGFAHADGGPSWRVGGGGGFSRMHSGKIAWEATRLGQGDEATKWCIETSRKQGLWGMTSATAALFGHANPLLRLDASRQTETSWSQYAPAHVAAEVSNLLARPWGTWVHNIRLAWSGGSLTGRAAPSLDDPTTLAYGESFGQTYLGRAGALVAPADFGLTAGVSRLQQTSRVITLRRVAASTPTFEVVLKQQRHTSVRGFGTFTGGVGYDRGGRDIVADTCQTTFCWDDAPSRKAYQALLRTVRSASNDFVDQRLQLQALAQAAGAVATPHGRISGQITSHELGTQVGLFPSEVLMRWLPINFEPSMAWQGQSVRLTHEALGAATKSTPQGITVHHDRVRTFGPEGRQLCRTQAVVGQGPGDEGPQVQLLHHWEMTRADAFEVADFILRPLAQLVPIHAAPLYGAGWRHERHATLSRALDATDLRQLASADAQACKEAADACSFVVPQEALLKLVAQLRLAVGTETTHGPWPAKKIAALADAFDAWTFAARLASIVPLHHLLRATKQLHITTFAQPYVAPKQALQRLQLAATQTHAAASLAAPCAEARHELALARALLQTDPLVGPSQRGQLHNEWAEVGQALTNLEAQVAAAAA